MINRPSFLILCSVKSVETLGENNLRLLAILHRDIQLSFGLWQYIYSCNAPDNKKTHLNEKDAEYNPFGGSIHSIKEVR